LLVKREVANDLTFKLRVLEARHSKAAQSANKQELDVCHKELEQLIQTAAEVNFFHSHPHYLIALFFRMEWFTSNVPI